MTELSLRPYLNANGAKDGVRACCGAGNIRLRELLSSFDVAIYKKWMSPGGGDGKLGWPTSEATICQA